MHKAVLIFSGGQDSTTCLGWALKHYDEVECLTIRYGQRHAVEIEQAEWLADSFSVPWKLVDASALAEVNDTSDLLAASGQFDESGERPSSWVPDRNALFITLGHARAHAIGAEAVITGVSQIDYSGYPDCRKPFINSLEYALGLGIDQVIRIETPLINKTKAETFAMADRLGMLQTVLEYSHTCYNGDRGHRHDWGYGCGRCPACSLRAQGWAEYVR